MVPYITAYAVGYFYGRAYPSYEADDITMPEQDHCYRDSLGFKDGFVAGRRDFESIDLPLEVLSPTAEAE